LNPPAAQLVDGHGGQGDRARPAALGFLLTDGAGIGLLGAGDYGKLAVVQVDGLPAQGSDFAAAEAAERLAPAG